MTRELRHGFNTATWRETPALTGRIATKADLDEGRAAFAIIERDGRAMRIGLPAPAIWTDPYADTEVRHAALVIQAESHVCEGGRRAVFYGLVLPNGRLVFASGPDTLVTLEPQPGWRDLVHDGLRAAA